MNEGIRLTSDPSSAASNLCGSVAPWVQNGTKLPFLQQVPYTLRYRDQRYDEDVHTDSVPFEDERKHL